MILGWAINADEPSFLRRTIRVNTEGKNLDGLFSGVIEPLMRTFLAILDHAGDTRIYMDGLGSLSVVFDPVAGVAGSTASCILNEADYHSRFDSDLRQAMEIERKGWFPAGRTAHRGVERLIANHFLDCRK